MSTTTHGPVPTINAVPEQEEVLLREAVAGICSELRPRVQPGQGRAGEPPTELWDALAESGYLGVNIPEEYDGGGLGMAALSMVGEEISAAGCSLLLIVVSPAIAGSILTRHGSEEQKDRWLRGIGGGHDQDRLRDHRARRRHELAQPVHLARSPTARASA